MKSHRFESGRNTFSIAEMFGNWTVVPFAFPFLRWLYGLGLSQLMVKKASRSVVFAKLDRVFSVDVTKWRLLRMAEII